MMGTKCCGSKTDSRMGVGMRRQDPSYGEVVHKIYEFMPFIVEVTALRLGARELGRLDYECVVTGGANPCA